jgi:tripartite-type tricarboxylate transporter receptor subunit TctC
MPHGRNLRLGLFIAVCLTVLASTASPPASAASFYAGKTLTLLIATPPGGGYDNAARLLARYLRAYIPGEPIIVPQNMPGAGGLRLANYLASVAVRDGTTIAMHTRGIIQASMIGDPAAHFDPREFAWLGTMSSSKGDAYLLVVNQDRFVRSVEDMRQADRPVTLGSVGGVTTNVIFALLSPSLFGFNTHLIRGYNGSNEVMLAVGRKEVDGAYTGLSSLATFEGDAIKSGALVPILQLARRDRHPDYPDVPLASELLTNPNDKALLAFVESVFFVALPVSGPPGMPADRVEILRDAFMKANADPAYLADAQKLKLDSSPLDGAEVERIIADMTETPPAIVERYKTVLKEAGE